ncbi:MAG: tyrosine-type recombinase/integrase [Verrucomicrobiota bacterium]
MKKTSKSYPRIVRSGSARVRVRQYQNKGHTYYRVEWWLGGRRCTEQHRTEADALREAQTKATQLARGDVDSAQLRGTDRLVYGRAVEFLVGLDTKLDLAAAEYAEARKALKAVPLSTAVDFWLKHHPDGFQPITVREAVDQFLAASEAKGLRSRTLEDYRSRLNRFAEAFQCSLTSVSAGEFEKWITSVAKSAATHTNFRRVCGTFFTFAQQRRWIPAETNPVSAVVGRKAARVETEVFSADELQRLLNAADPDQLPTLLLGAFAGLRVSETQRLRWENIKWDEDQIVVEASGAKTARRRTVPICEALRKWLLPISVKEGPIWPHKGWAHAKRQQQLALDAGVAWKDNGLRHSYISYRLAVTQNENVVALEAGNSPTMIHQHYKALVSRREAARWFEAVRPDQATQKVIPIASAA